MGEGVSLSIVKIQYFIPVLLKMFTNALMMAAGVTETSATCRLYRYQNVLRDAQCSAILFKKFRRTNIMTDCNVT